MERGLDPLTTNLVVADPERTEKTICLAVSPSLKAYGIPGRARLFEVVQKVKEVNAGHPKKERLTYQIAPPRMALYMDYSTKFTISICVMWRRRIFMSILSTRVFMDVTHYLGTYHMTARELAAKMIQDVFAETGITATAGIGTNLYLCKVALDIVAKHVKAGSEWCAHCKTGRDELPQTALELPSADGFHGRWDGATRRSWRRTVCIRWETLRAARWEEPREFHNEELLLPAVRHQCGAAHRSCMGLGAGDDGTD